MQIVPTKPGTSLDGPQMPLWGWLVLGGFVLVGITIACSVLITLYCVKHVKVRCKNCGKNMLRSDKFCKNCGKEVK